MEIEKIEKISGAFVIRGQRHGDERGYFQEFFNTSRYPAEIKDKKFPQIAQSMSCKNTIRGLHCTDYAKFITVPQGAAFDVIVDLREKSPTFMNWAGVRLDDGITQFYIPGGCAHGFLALEDNTTMLYLQEGCFTPTANLDVNLFDPKINIEWPKADGASEYIISAKDKNAPNAEDALKTRSFEFLV